MSSESAVGGAESAVGGAESAGTGPPEAGPYESAGTGPRRATGTGPHREPQAGSGEPRDREAAYLARLQEQVKGHGRWHGLR